MQLLPLLRKIVLFYLEGFRGMTLGRVLWAIILAKLILLFGVLKLFFFRDPLAGCDERQRGGHLLEHFVERP